MVQFENSRVTHPLFSLTFGDYILEFLFLWIQEKENDACGHVAHERIKIIYAKIRFMDCKWSN